MAGNNRPEDQGEIDEQFNAIISGLDMPTPGGDGPDAQGAGPGSSEGHGASRGRSAADGGASARAGGNATAAGDGPPGATAPDGGPGAGQDPGEEGHGSARRVEISLLLPGIDNVEAIAAVCKLAGVSAMCLPSDIGVIVALSDASQQASREAAQSFSALLRAVPVVLLRRGPSSDPSDSDVQASRWLAGAEQEALAPGLILAQAPDVIEGLILGDLSSRDVPGALDAGGMSKIKATRILARLLRGNFGTTGRNGRGAQA